MGRGRKPTPTKLKILHGNPGRKPINQNEPKPKDGLPTAPRHLSAGAKKAWKKLRPELEACGIATQVDTVAFEMLCTAYADYLEACKKVNEFGAIWIEKGESQIPKFAYSPYWSVMNREWKKIQTMLVEFGMTPSSRSKVTAVPKSGENSAEDRYFG